MTTATVVLLLVAVASTIAVSTPEGTPRPEAGNNRMFYM
jgi:hypothetical protein